MEILILAVVAVVVGGLIYIQHNKSRFDSNKDGKVDAAEVKAAAAVVKEEVKAAAKKTATKAKTAVAKTTAKKTKK